MSRSWSPSWGGSGAKRHQGHIPTDAELEAMSDAELDAFLAADGQEEAAVTAGATHAAGSQAGGAEEPGGTVSSLGSGSVQFSGSGMGRTGLDRAQEPAAGPHGAMVPQSLRRVGALLCLLSLIAVGASWALVHAEVEHLRTPDTQLGCDINVLVSCGASLDAWQGNVLGVPNAFLGGMAFACLALLGALIAAGTRLPRWVWQGMSAGAVAGLATVAWFVFTSITVFMKLCPLCLIVWTVTIPIAWLTWAAAATQGALGNPSGGVPRMLVRGRWWGIALSYLLVLTAVVVGLWEPLTALW